MTLEQIDIAIAEHLEWSEIRVGEGARIWGNRPNSVGQDYRKAAVPQFHACLNAMHWAELFLQNDDPHAYACYCCDLSDGRISAVSKTAYERATCFLQTIGKWQEPDKLSTHVAV